MTQAELRWYYTNKLLADAERGMWGAVYQWAENATLHAVVMRRCDAERAERKNVHDLVLP